MIMKNRILIIGCGWEQESLLQEIKKMGFYIIGTNPTVTAQLLNYCDKYLVKDSNDIKSHINIAETYEIDAVISDNCDYSLYTSSIVASALKLPFVDIHSALLSNNKFKQRQLIEAKKIRQPRFRLIHTLDEIRDATIELQYPVIVKPVDSRGTFGVTIVKKDSELRSAFFEAISNSPSKRVICEQFITGTLVTVDGFCFNEGHVSLTVASRVFEEGLKPVTKEIIYPADFDDELILNLMHYHNEVVNTFNYTFGHTHGEYIVTEDQDIYLVECTNRGGGVYTSSTILPLLTEINVNKIYIDQCMGIDQYKFMPEGKTHMKNSVMLTFLDFQKGNVIESINTEELNELPYVVKFRTIYKKNEMVESIEDCSSRHSMLVISSPNSPQTYRNLKDFKSKMKIKYYAL